MNARRDLVVLFFNQNCAHCRDALPTWNEFGQLMARHNSDGCTSEEGGICVAQLDVSQSVVPEGKWQPIGLVLTSLYSSCLMGAEIELDGVPSLLLFRAGNKAP